MYVTCLDLEGVLVPEIWIAFAEETKISELRLTTRDIPDYAILMKQRIEILKKHNFSLHDIQNTIAKINPMPGAKNFLDDLRNICQVIILSDTFTQFAAPLMAKLGFPTIFCNELIIDTNNMICGYKMRQQNGKFHAIKALQSIGFNTVASGDSFNDLAMIKQAEKGFLFKAPEHIIKDNPDIQAFTEYDQLLQAIKESIQ